MNPMLLVFMVTAMTAQFFLGSLDTNKDFAQQIVKMFGISFRTAKKN